MRISRIIWLEHIIDKITEKHAVTVEEVEEVLALRPKMTRVEKGRFQGEDVYRALGQAQSGRYLVVFFIYKRTGEALILSARDMDDKERRGYGRK